VNEFTELELRNRVRSGLISRREVLTAGLRLGLSTSAIMALMAMAPEASASSASRSFSSWLRHQEGGSGTFTYLRDGGIPDLDPHYAYDNAAQSVILGVYEMLIQYNGEATDDYAPMLAQSWEVNEDESVFTFTLPEGVLFHDGDPCTAQSVKDAFERCILQNAAVANVVTRFVPDPEMMEVVDELNIRFNLERPQPLFLAAMASSYGPFIVNTKYVEEFGTDDDPWAHEWFRENGIGTGPYQLIENLPTERIIMERFDDFHGGWEGNHFDRIVLRVVPEVATRRQLIEQGEADATSQNLTPNDVEALRDNDDVQVITFDSTAVFWAVMNAPRMRTVDVRRGFSYAFPYEEVVDSAYQGLIRRSGPIPTTVRGYDPDVFLYQTDLKLAKELILSGGFEEGDAFDYLLEGGDEVESTVAQLFQANVAEIGFNLEIQTVERATLIDLMYGSAPAEERPMFFGGWGWWPDYNDPWNQMYPNFTQAATGGGGSNGGYYVNERFEEIMAEVENYEDEERMLELMKEAQNILTEQDPPVIFYGQLLWYALLRHDIQGFVPNSLYLNAYNFHQMSRAES
jgi:peptide/nickel transport system substrate-binding protein